MIACLASQPSFPAFTDGGNECWLVSWRTSHMSEAPCQPCKSFYFLASIAFGHPHFLGKSRTSVHFLRYCFSNCLILARLNNYPKGCNVDITHSCVYTFWTMESKLDAISTIVSFMPIIGDTVDDLISRLIDSSITTNRMNIKLKYTILPSGTVQCEIVDAAK